MIYLVIAANILPLRTRMKIGGGRELRSSGLLRSE